MIFGKKPKNQTIEDVVKSLLPNAIVKEGMCEGAKPIQRVPWLD